MLTCAECPSKWWMCLPCETINDTDKKITELIDIKSSSHSGSYYLVSSAEVDVWKKYWDELLYVDQMKRRYS